MTYTLSQIADRLGLAWEGRDVPIESPSLMYDAGPGRLTLATTDRYATDAAERGTSALLAPLAVETALPVLRSDRPRVAFARVLALFDERPRPHAGIHPSAIIAPSARIGAEVSIGPYAVIDDGAEIGPRSHIGAHACIGPSVHIGEDSSIGPGVVIYDGCLLGARVQVQANTCIGSDGFGYEWDGTEHIHVPHIGIVVIEDDVEIGASAAIDRAKTGETRISHGAKLDNFVHIAHGVRVGPHCLLAAQVGTAGSAVIETGAVLGGQVGVADNVVVGAGALVAARSGITGDVPPGGVYMGFPLRDAAKMRRIFAAETHLPDLLRRVRALERHLAAGTDSSTAGDE